MWVCIPWVPCLSTHFFAWCIPPLWLFCGFYSCLCYCLGHIMVSLIFSLWFSLLQKYIFVFFLVIVWILPFWELPTSYLSFISFCDCLVCLVETFSFYVWYHVMLLVLDACLLHIFILLLFHVMHIYIYIYIYIYNIYIYIYIYHLFTFMYTVVDAYVYNKYIVILFKQLRPNSVHVSWTWYTFLLIWYSVLL